MRRKRRNKVKKTVRTRSKRVAVNRQAVKRQKVRTISIPWQPILAVLLIVSLGSWGLVQDPLSWFRVKNVEVAAGTEHLSEEQIAKLAEVPLGESLMKLDLPAIRERLTKHPWIKSVALRRVFPHTLYIQVWEQEPLAMVLLPKAYLVSREGVVFKQVGRADTSELPKITGLKSGPDSALTERVQRRIDDSLAVLRVLQTTAALQSYGLKEITWKDQRTLSLKTVDPGFTISLGEAPWHEKLNRLIQVLPHLDREQKVPKRISLDQGEGVVVRYSNLSKEKI